MPSCRMVAVLGWCSCSWLYLSSDFVFSAQANALIASLVLFAKAFSRRLHRSIAFEQSCVLKYPLANANQPDFGENIIRNLQLRRFFVGYPVNARKRVFYRNCLSLGQCGRLRPWRRSIAPYRNQDDPALIAVLPLILPLNFQCPADNLVLFLIILAYGIFTVEP